MQSLFYYITNITSCAALIYYHSKQTGLKFVNMQLCYYENFLVGAGCGPLLSGILSDEFVR